jgi:Flp pilus assembly protein TadG
MLRHIREERGAAAVEFALILPILVLLVFGIVEFSLAFNRQQGLHAAAREGARIASLPSTPTGEIEDRVKTALNGVIDPSDASITITSDGPSTTQPCDQNPGGTVIVRVTFDNTIDVPFLATPSVTLTGRGEFRCE